MRVLILTNSRYNFYNYRYDLWRYLVGEGYEVFVTFPTKTENDTGLLSGFIYLPSLERSFVFHKELLAYRELKKEIHRLNIDIVLSFTPKMVLMAGFLKNVVSVGTLTGLGSIFLKGFLAQKIILYTISRRYTGPKKQLVCQNRADALLLQRPNRCEPILIEGSGVEPRKVEAKRKQNPNLSFLFAGRALKDKGIIEMFRAFDIIYSKRCDFKLVIAGDVDLQNPSSLTELQFNNLLSKDYVEYVGWTNDMTNLYDRCDVAILPSYREGLSKFLLEAMSAGLPLLVSNVPGCQDLIDGNGYSFDVRNVDDFTNKIEIFLNMDSDQMRKLSVRSSNLIEEKYSISIVNKSYNEVIGKWK